MRGFILTLGGLVALLATTLYRVLWDQALTRHSTRGAAEPEVIYVPVAGADWRQGELVHLIA